MDDLVSFSLQADSQVVFVMVDHVAATSESRHRPNCRVTGTWQ